MCVVCVCAHVCVCMCAHVCVCVCSVCMCVCVCMCACVCVWATLPDCSLKYPPIFYRSKTPNEYVLSSGTFFFMECCFALLCSYLYVVLVSRICPFGDHVYNPSLLVFWLKLIIIAIKTHSSVLCSGQLQRHLKWRAAQKLCWKSFQRMIWQKGNQFTQRL